METPAGLSVNSSRLKKSHWRDGIRATRAALVLGVVAIGIGLIDPRMYQESKVLAALAVVAILVSATSIGMTLWQLELRSVRLRNPAFWASLAINLILIFVISLLLFRGMEGPSLNQKFSSAGATGATETP